MIVLNYILGIMLRFKGVFYYYKYVIVFLIFDMVFVFWRSDDIFVVVEYIFGF